MRISDWSSDVCSSDLVPVIDGYENMRRIHGVNGWRQLLKLIADDRALRYEKPGEQLYLPHATIDYVNDIPCWPVPEAPIVFKIGRASCRERVCQYVSISVVAVSLKKNKKQTIKKD